MQVLSDRGLITIEAEYQSQERAEMDGYSYAWHDRRLGCDLMICHLPNNCASFAKIVGYV